MHWIAWKVDDILWLSSRSDSMLQLSHLLYTYPQSHVRKNASSLTLTNTAGFLALLGTVYKS
jgi:hypothetical protein